jgi:hypothetical protein
MCVNSNQRDSLSRALSASSGGRRIVLFPVIARSGYWLVEKREHVSRSARVQTALSTRVGLYRPRLLVESTLRDTDAESFGSGRDSASCRSRTDLAGRREVTFRSD